MPLPEASGRNPDSIGSGLERVVLLDNKINGSLFEFITEGPTRPLRFLWHNGLLKEFLAILPVSTSLGLSQVRPLGSTFSANDGAPSPLFERFTATISLSDFPIPYIAVVLLTDSQRGPWDHLGQGRKRDLPAPV